MVTRIQEFRQRNNLQKQLKQLAKVGLCVLVYFYCLLGFQPQQTHHDVVNLNLERYRDDWMDRFYSAQAQELGRGKSRTQKTLLKREQTQALKLWHYNHTSVVLRGTNSTLLNEDTSAEGIAGTADFLITFFALYMIARLIIRILLLPRLIQSNQPSVRIATSRQRANAVRFQRWANELNRQRVSQGERPLSMDALRLVLRERQVNDGNDYEGLLEFQEQSGPAMETLLQSMGATDEQIERLPSRILGAGDDLLKPSHGKLPDCSICLDHFEAGDAVRTIPCFHSFHVDCIDPWLRERASCPVCKHSAMT